MRKLFLIFTLVSIFTLNISLNAQDTEWTCGNVDSNINAQFNYTSWEGPGRIDAHVMSFDEFLEANYPNILQEPNTGVAWDDYWTTLPVQLAGGAEIDMMYMHDTRNETFANNGWLMPLDSYLEACPPPGWPDEFIGTQIDAFNFEGQQYGIPYDVAYGAWFINVDLFEEAGIPIPMEDSTWDDILQAAIALTKDTDGDGRNDVWGINGLGSPGGSANTSYWIVRSFGGDFWNDDITESRLTDPGTIEAYQMIYDMIWEYHVHPTAEAIDSTGLGPIFMFANGNVAIQYGINGQLARMAEVIDNKFNWTVAPTPTGPAGRFQFVGGSSLAIPTTSTQPDLAYEMIRYALSNPEILPRTAVMRSQYVSRTGFEGFVLPEDSAVSVEDFNHAYADLGKQDGVQPIYHPKYLEWEASVFIPTFDLLWTGEVPDVAEVAAQAEALTNTLLGS